MQNTALGFGLGMSRPITQAGAGGQSLDSRIRALFAKYSAVGGMWDFTDASTLFQDSAGTTPVTAASQPAGRANDLSGLGNHLIQATSASRPLYNGAGVTFDGVDDVLRSASSIDLSSAGTVYIALLFTPISASNAYPPYFIVGQMPWQPASSGVGVYGRSTASSVVGINPYTRAAGEVSSEKSFSLTQQAMVARYRLPAGTTAEAIRAVINGALVPPQGNSTISGAFPNAPVSMGSDPLGWGYSASYSVKRALVIGANLTDDEAALLTAWLGEVA